MKKFIFAILALFASFQANAEEQKLKEAGKIVCYGHQLNDSYSNRLFEISYYQSFPVTAQNCKKDCTSFEISKHIRVSNQVIDMKNMVTYSFMDQTGERTIFSHAPNEGFSCAIHEK